MLAISSMYDSHTFHNSTAITSYIDEEDTYSTSGDSTDTIRNEFSEEEIPIICDNVKKYLKDVYISEDELEDGIWLDDENIILFQRMYHNNTNYIVYFTKCDVNKNLYIGIFDLLTKDVN